MPVHPWATAYAPRLQGHVHEEFGHERPGEGGGQGVFAFVYGAGLQGGPDEELYEVFTGVEYLGLDGPRAQGPLTHLFQVYLAAHVYGKGHDIGVVAVGKPFDGYGGVEPPLYARTIFWVTLFLCKSRLGHGPEGRIQYVDCLVRLIIGKNQGRDEPEGVGLYGVH